MKKIVSATAMLGIVFCIVCFFNIDANAAVRKNQKDVAALNEIIKSQEKYGNFYQKLYHEENYVWDKKSGRLKKIIWKDIPIFGELNFNKFDALEYIYLYDDSASDLNITKLKNLKVLVCLTYLNPVTIKFGNLENLTTLKVYNCQLKNLDYSDLKKLKVLMCPDTNIRAESVSHIKTLKKLDLSYNKIRAIDVSKLTNLRVLNLEFNKLKELDVSNLKKLKNLNVSYNRLKTIDISKLMHLTHLDIRLNHFKNIDVSHLRKLKKLDVSYNELTSLDISKCKRPPAQPAMSST